MDRKEELLRVIESSTQFSEVRSTGLLPEPDSDDGYYFISYSHKDYKKVTPELLHLQGAGVKIWYDRGLESGKSWINEVKKKITSYYCKGVIFYISRNYLESESCMLEFLHFANLLSKSCLFVLLDDAFGEDGNGVLEAVKRFDIPPEDSIDVDLLLMVDERLPYEAALEEKLNALARFVEPELLQYTYLYQMGGLSFKFLDLFVGRTAVVSGIVDKNVKQVTVPTTVYSGGKTYKVIGVQADVFRNCERLEEVEIGDGWMLLEKNSFVRCPRLRRVRLGKPRRLFGKPLGVLDRILDRCPQAKLKLDDLRVIYHSTFKNSEDITEAVHREELGWMGECFAGCRRLNRAVLNEKDNWGEGMFAGCIALTEVEIPAKNATRTAQRSFSGCKSLRRIVLPRGLRSIGEETFADCTSLEEIVIPPRVGEIHRTAFARCTALGTVTVEGKRFDYMVNTPTHRKACFDELFPALRRIYLRTVPEGLELFRGRFEEIPCDRRGYRLFERREQA